MKQIALLSGPPDVVGTRLIADLTRKVSGCTSATDKHGMADLQLTIDEPSLAAQFRVADRQGLPWLYVGDGGPADYVGRLEDVTIAGGGLQLTAYGAWRGFSDAPYTALWSESSVAEWFQPTAQQIASSYDDRFSVDANNRLQVAPQNNSVQGNTPLVGYLAYAAVSGGQRLITNISFDYTYGGATNWIANCQSWTAPDPISGAWTVIANLWVGAATPSAAFVSGSQSITLGTPTNALTFGFSFNGAPAVYAGQTGDVLLRITNLRITTIAAPVEADDIAGALVTHATGINSGVLSAVTSRISAPGLDLFQETYLDQTPAAILERLERLGDSSGREWRAWVGADRILAFEPWGTSGRTWYVDVTDLQIQRTLETLANSVYAVYQDASNRPVRTAASSNTLSQSRYGLTRRQALGTQTTSATQAGVERDTRLADTATPPARAGITFTAVYTAYGARVPLERVRAGDTFILRNLAPSLSVDVDKIRVIRIGRAVWDLIANTLSIEPQVPLPTLETMLARQENANAR